MLWESQDILHFGKFQIYDKHNDDFKKLPYKPFWSVFNLQEIFDMF